MKFQKKIDTIIGNITIIEENEKIINIQLGRQTSSTLSIKDIVEKDTPILLQTEIELQEYLQGKRKKFNIPLNPQGTEFRHKVWNELLNIPYGKLVTYKDIAIKIGNEKAARAVGMANHYNPIPIIIPCHRVIGQNNKLTGYALGLDLKQFLIDLEKQKNSPKILDKRLKMV